MPSLEQDEVIELNWLRTKIRCLRCFRSAELQGRRSLPSPLEENDGPIFTSNASTLPLHFIMQTTLCLSEISASGRWFRHSLDQHHRG